jgi:CHAT domain-containing protein
LLPDVRSIFFASQHRGYELYVDLLYRRKQKSEDARYDALAFQVSERARARSFLEMLSSKIGQIQKGINSELKGKEDAIMELINSKIERRSQIARESADDPGLLALNREIETLIIQREQLEQKIRQESPQYFALINPDVVNVSDIQTGLIDPNTVLLEYMLGSERSFLWVVSQSEINMYQLPPKDTIEKFALQTYSDLSDSDSANRINLKKDDPLLKELSKILLLPVQKKIAGKDLLIVADGILQYLPFGILYDPDQSGQPLVLKHKIAVLPSAMTLYALRKYQQPPKSMPRIAVIADPVYDSEDPRIKNNGNPGGSGSSSDRFSRLPFSRREAQSIASLLPAKNVWLAMDFDANRATLLDSRLADYSFIHLATHAIVDDSNPQASALVLSLVDSSGNPAKGIISIPEIFNMNLNAEMVVLSGCRTALGKDIHGEGLMGLARAFMYAGSSRVVASLWKVDDSATSIFMKKFYERLFRQPKSTPIAALQAAQKYMLSQERWQDPYYWAGFILIGEYR